MPTKPLPPTCNTQGERDFIEIKSHKGVVGGGSSPLVKELTAPIFFLDIDMFIKPMCFTASDYVTVASIII